MNERIIEREFVCYWHFVGWWAFSLGFHVDCRSPNFEIHLPFGFLRIGWKRHAYEIDRGKVYLYIPYSYPRTTGYQHGCWRLGGKLGAALCHRAQLKAVERYERNGNGVSLHFSTQRKRKFKLEGTKK